MSRVLLLTSHPLSPPWDSADKELAASVARSLPHRFVGFRRAGRPPLDGLPGALLPVLSRDGRPGRLERAQIVALAQAIEPAVDLVHAVLSIGPSFGMLPALRRFVPAAVRRPVLHTVPGVLDPSVLERVRPVGLTVALSDVTADLLRSHGFGDVRVVPPAIRLDRWTLRPRPAVAPQVVLFAGHFDAGGGAEEAIGTVAAARRERPGTPIRLVLAMRTRLGQDEAREAERLRRFAATHRVDDLEILGIVADMPALVSRASVVLMPATDLGGKADVPLVVLQAMAVGRPVLLTDLPTLRPAASTLPLFEPGNVSAMGGCLASLLDDAAAWSHHAAAGRRTVEDRYSESAMAAAYESLYGELAIRRA